MSLTRQPRSGVTPQAVQPAPPSRLYSFTGWQASNPTAPPPGDRMDADYDNTNTALTQTLSWAATSLNTDGTLKAGSVGQSQMVSGLFDDIAQDIIAEVQPLVDQAQGYAASAAGSSTTAQAAATAADRSNTAAAGAASTATAAANTATAAQSTAQGYATTAQTAATNAHNSDNDAEGSAALAQDYADVTQAWAEHMPDTIPPNILAVMGVSGDHWSSRWWANQAARYAGLSSTVVTADTPPPAPLPGQLWFDTANAQLYVWFVDPTSAQWVIATANAGGLSVDAPADGAVYGRQNAGWTSLSGASGFLPLAGGTVGWLEIARASSAVWQDSAPARLFNVHNAWTGTSTLPSAVDLNRILTVDSISAAPGSFGGGGFVTALNLESQTGGAASTGGRIALNVLQRQTASTGNFAAGGAYNGVAASFVAIADFNEGGTSFIPGSHTGSLFGINPAVALRNTATYFSELCGGEVNVTAHLGSSVFVKYGWTIVKEAADAVQGAAGLDSALAFSDQLGAQPWDYGILFGNEGGQWAFDANATLMGTRLNTSQGTGGAIGTAKWVMDFLPMTTTGGLLRGTGFVIENTGITRVGFGALKPDPAGMLIDTDGKQAASATIANGGSNYTSGGYWPDVNGNVWHIDSVGGGGNVTGVTLVKAVVTGTQSTPIALAPSPYVLQATGAQLAVTYASGTRLMLQPSGGAIMSGLLPNAANDVAAAAAGIQLHQWYRNGSAVMQRIA